MKFSLSTAIKARREIALYFALTLSAFVMLKIPILYIGTGEGRDDIVPFDVRTFVEELCS